MGNYIRWFEKHFYKDSVARGWVLLISLAALTFLASFYLSVFITSPWIQGIIASTALASNMLRKCVLGVIGTPVNIRYLVSRDTENLSEREICRAALETYAENLSDGVVAPVFYLLLFGLPGVFVYKAVNTLDSMVGYRNKRYSHFGKASARADDLLNYIPARITALIILVLSFRLEKLIRTRTAASGHSSPNAGYPISAMAFALNVSLGGPTSYFGQIENKPFFGEGRRNLNVYDLRRAASVHMKLDLLILVFSLCCCCLHYEPADRLAALFSASAVIITG
jgi:adenosylcobinamide-phosphate synthase